jgi:hypothetical protein
MAASNYPSEMYIDVTVIPPTDAASFYPKTVSKTTPKTDSKIYYAVMAIGWDDEVELVQRLFKSKKRALTEIAEMVTLMQDLEAMNREGEPMTVKGLKQWKKDAKGNVKLDDYVEYIDSDGVRYKVVPMTLTL